MLRNVKNAVLKLENGEMEYIRFGSGERVLVMLPGLGDGLRSMKGTAIPMAFMYRLFAKEFTVYAFSRKHELPQGYTTRDMAADQAEAMQQLGIRKANILGVSMGGMLAQHLAIDYPELVGRLVLVVTAARPNPMLTESVEEWITQAKQDDHAALMDSNLRRIYSDDYYRKNRHLLPVLARLTKPNSYDRFLVQAAACLCHDAYADLPKIQSPTLVIGGAQDRCLDGESSREIADQIPGAMLHMYAQWGHGLYDEAQDFNQVVMQFLK